MFSTNPKKILGSTKFDEQTGFFFQLIRIYMCVCDLILLKCLYAYIYLGRCMALKLFHNPGKTNNYFMLLIYDFGYVKLWTINNLDDDDDDSNNSNNDNDDKESEKKNNGCEYELIQNWCRKEHKGHGTMFGH